MTHWSFPILPIVKNILDIKLGEYVYVFHSHDYADKYIYI